MKSPRSRRIFGGRSNTGLNKPMCLTHVVELNIARTGLQVGGHSQRQSQPCTIHRYSAPKRAPKILPYFHSRHVDTPQARGSRTNSAKRVDRSPVWLAARTCSEVKKEIALELAHVLFINIVGSPKLRLTSSGRYSTTLNQVVRGTDEFRCALQLREKRDYNRPPALVRTRPPVNVPPFNNQPAALGHTRPR